MTERERINTTPALPAGPILRPFVRLEIRFRDGALYCPRWPADDEQAPDWRGTYASSAPIGWAALQDTRPMYTIGMLIATPLGHALVAAHGDIIEASAMEMVQ